MAVTVQQIAYAVRLIPDVKDTVDASVSQEITRLAAVIDELIASYAPLAPEPIKDEAKIMFISYVFESLNDNERPRYPDALSDSGALNLLYNWVAPASGVIDPGSTTVPVPSSGGLTAAQVLALIADWAEAGNASQIPQSKLPAAPQGTGLTVGERATLQHAVQYDGIQLSGRDITYATDGGQVTTITVPGITVLNEQNAVIGGTNGTTQLKFQGTGVSISRVGANTVVSITAGTGGGGGVTLSQVRNEINSNSKIISFQEFEDALRTQTTLVSQASIRVAAGNQALPVLNGLTPITLPDLLPDRQAKTTIHLVSVAKNATFNFDLQALYNKPATSSGLQLSSTNAVQQTAEGVLFSFARTSNNQILFSADTIGDYNVTIVDDLIDILGEARTKATFDASVKALVADWAEQGNTTPIPNSKLPTIPTLTQIDQRIRLLLADWAEADNVDTIPASKIPAGSTGTALSGLRTVVDGTITGFTVTDPSIDRLQNGQTPGNANPPGTHINIATPLNDHGEFHYSIELTISGGNSVDREVTFEGENKSVVFTGVMFSSALRRTTTFGTGPVSSPTPAKGLLIQEVNINGKRTAGTVDNPVEPANLGTVRIYFGWYDGGTTGQKLLLWVILYDGNPAAAGNTNFSVTGSMNLSFQSGDNQLLLYSGPTAPSSPVLGDLWSDTTAKQLKRYNGMAWVRVGAPAGASAGKFVGSLIVTGNTGATLSPSAVPSNMFSGVTSPYRALSNGTLHLPQLAPEDVRGLLYVVKVNGVIVSRNYKSWAFEYAGDSMRKTGNSIRTTLLPASTIPDTVSRALNAVFVTRVGRGNEEIIFRGNGDALLPNTTVEVYEWI